MSINSEAKDDIKAAQRVRLPWWALVSIGVLSLPVFWLFDHFGSLDRSLPVLDSIIPFAFVLYAKWKFRRKWWFWLTIALVALLQALLIWSIPWTEAWKPALAAGVVVSAEICLLLWLLATVEKFVSSATVTEPSQD